MALSLHHTINRARPFLVKLQHFFIRFRLALLITAAISIVAFELVEHPDFLTEDTAYFFKEVSIYISLIIMVMVLVELTLRANVAKNQIIKILDARHNLSMQLTAAKDWDEVVTKILQYPSTILPVSATTLLIFDSATDAYVTERSWVAENESMGIPKTSILRLDCCTDDLRAIYPNIHQVNGSNIFSDNNKNQKCYHIAINYGDTPFGVLYLVLPEADNLTSDQLCLLSNTAEDMGIGLGTARQRQVQHSAELANAALNERLEIARDLHDSLGQNLGYLHLKLDQMLTESNDPSYQISLVDLKRLREVANESYELVRSTLVILHHKSDHHISELFKAHTQIISKRASIPINVDEEGMSQPLPPHYLKQLLYAFKEALHNIEKHSGANRAEVKLTWTKDQLKVKIRDDGRGLEVNQPTDNGHFGLRNINDRIQSLGGKVEINSSPGEGTEVMFLLPLTTPS